MFFNSLRLPVLSKDHRGELDASIRIEEINKAIEMLRPNTYVGPDRFTVEFYIKFSPVLLDYLCELFLRCQQEDNLPAP